MQIYSTIFPVTDMLTQDTLIRLVIEWNQGSPYNKLSNLNWDGKSRNIKFEEENLSLEIQEIRAYNTIAIRFHQFDENNIIWNTDVVVNFDKKRLRRLQGLFPSLKHHILLINYLMVDMLEKIMECRFLSK